MDCHSAICAKQILDFANLLQKRPNVYVQVSVDKKQIIAFGLLLEFQARNQESQKEIAIFRCRITGALFFRDGAGFQTIQDFCQEMNDSKKTTTKAKISWTIRIDWRKNEKEIAKWQQEFPPTTEMTIRLVDENQKVYQEIPSWFQSTYTGGLSTEKPLQLTRTIQCS